MDSTELVQRTGRLGVILRGYRANDDSFIAIAYRQFLQRVLLCIDDGRFYLIDVHRSEIQDNFEIARDDKYKLSARIVLAHHEQAEVGEYCILPDDARADYIYSGEGSPMHEWRYADRVYRDCGWLSPNGESAYMRMA